MELHVQEEYLRKLLDAWELTYKKGQMSFWILFTLSQGASDVQNLQQKIKIQSNEQIQFDEQSLYRSLRRFYETELVDFVLIDGQKGPKRKEYMLTGIGLELLKLFLHRNFQFLLDADFQKHLKTLTQ
ncbi:MAG: PadR family transcriptional regulator [Chitinophagaceae bacterium]|nr:PadR family transcriptional regulator [Chitinophagaceae bacterium]